MRKKLSAKEANSFTSKPVAKKKSDRKLGDAMTKEVGENRRGNTEYVDDKTLKAIGGAALRGVAEETMARVYSEMFPNMQVRNPVTDEVDLEIREEAYILGLTMVCGNNDYKPRKGLKIREHEFTWLKLCAEHKEQTT